MDSRTESPAGCWNSIGLTPKYRAERRMCSSYMFSFCGTGPYLRRNRIHRSGPDRLVSHRLATWYWHPASRPC